MFLRTNTLKFLLLVLLSLLGTKPVYSQAKLRDAIALHPGRNILDVELHGHASPWVCDLDHKRSRDLLVGEEYQGRLRVYLDVDLSLDLSLEGYSLLHEMYGGGTVPEHSGFSPQVVDLDQDGLDDIVSPAWYGMVYWFRQKEKGKFEAGRPIVGSDGNAIQMEWTHGATTADWNNDGKLDLIVGLSHQAGEGGLVVLMNVSQPKLLQFARPVLVMDGDKPLDIPAESPSPTAADWDGDGFFDLLMGAGDGSVRFYRNLGTQVAPKFSGFEEVISAAELGDKSKICVVDWDLDGKLDLVVGDHGKAFEKVHSPRDEEWKLEAKRSHDDAMARWGQAYRSYSQFLQQKAKPAVIEHYRQLLIEENQRQEAAHARFKEFSLRKQYHGKVWVFLRK